MGCHGCGKSSTIDLIKLNHPTTKMLDLDLNPKLQDNNPCAANQHIRHSDYFDNLTAELNKLPEQIILIDRAPISLNIYDESFKELGIVSEGALNRLRKDWRDRLERFNEALLCSKHESFGFFLDVPVEVIKENIIERARDDNFNEQDWAYLEMIHKMYQERVSEVEDFYWLNWDPALSKEDNYDEFKKIIEDTIKERVNG